LGSIGPDNQFDANRTVLNEDEVKHRTKLWDPLGFEKGLEADTQSSTFELPPMEELFPSDLSNWLLPAFSGSNLFVIHGNHTTTGKPILASDPHLETQMPCLWYQAEIIYTHEGSEHFVIGAQLPGIPVTMSGRNQYHAWGLTILYSDSADLWQEEIIERDGKHYYRYKDELLLVRETEEVILIKGQSEPVKFNVMYTHHGAVMNSDMFRPKTRHNNSYISFQSVAPIDDHVGIRYECIGHSSGFLRFLHEKDLA
jgi:acyl-homoserine lactone acylase PvdQ